MSKNAQAATSRSQTEPGIQLPEGFLGGPDDREAPRGGGARRGVGFPAMARVIESGFQDVATAIETSAPADRVEAAAVLAMAVGRGGGFRKSEYGHWFSVNYRNVTGAAECPREEFADKMEEARGPGTPAAGVPLVPELDREDLFFMHAALVVMDAMMPDRQPGATKQG